MLDTPTPPETQEEHKPDGLNILEKLFLELRAIKEAVQRHEERLNNLTLNIPDQTVNALVARTLDMHAQVLLAATRPVQGEPTQEEPENTVATPAD